MDSYMKWFDETMNFDIAPVEDAKPEPNNKKRKREHSPPAETAVKAKRGRPNKTKEEPTKKLN